MPLTCMIERPDELESCEHGPRIQNEKKLGPGEKMKDHVNTFFTSVLSWWAIVSKVKARLEINIILKLFLHKADALMGL